MQFKNIPTDIKHALAATLVASIAVSTLAGAGVGFAVATWSQSPIQSIVASMFGFPAPASLVNTAQPKIQPIFESSATIDSVKQATPAVVSVVASQDLSAYYQQRQLTPFEQFFFGDMVPSQGAPQQDGTQEVGAGSGFIITTDGLIVTNRHVVENELADYAVVLNDGTKYDAFVLAKDTLNDIAILKIEADNLPVLDLGDSEQIQIGQTVIAIGNSLGEYSNTVTKGVISGINRRVVAGDGTGFSEVIEEALQTDAAINPGNSGGPLIDLFGKVVGVNTAVSQAGQLIGFAIPINEVKNVIESVQQYGRIVRPFLGVRYLLLTPEFAKANDIADIEYGALVIRGDARTDVAVVPGSPADKAGIVENDIIVSINGEKITQERVLAKIVSQYKATDTITLEVYRKGEIIEIDVTLMERAE